MQIFAEKYLFPFLLSLYGAGFAMLSAISWHRQSFFQIHIETFTEPQRTAVLYVFFGLLIVYALIAHNIRHAQTFPLRKTMLLSMPFILLLVCTPPLLSTDTAIYVTKAKNFVQLQKSPYEASPIDPSWKNEIEPMPWAEIGSLYGPLFHIVTIPLGGLSSASASVSIFIYKISLIPLFLASIWLMNRLLKHLHAPSYFLLLYALNPALLINGIMEGHNDMLVLFTLLALFYFLKDMRYTKSMFVLGASVAIKYIAIILLPIFLIENRTLKWKRLGSAVVIIVLILYAGVIVFGFPFSDIVDKLQRFETFPCLFHCSPYATLTNAVADTHAQTVRLVSFVIVYFWILYYFLIKKYEPMQFAFWALLALIFIYSSWITPWYLIILIPFALLYARDRLYTNAFWVLTLYSFLSYF